MLTVEARGKRIDFKLAEDFVVRKKAGKKKRGKEKRRDTEVRQSRPRKLPRSLFATRSYQPTWAKKVRGNFRDIFPFIRQDRARLGVFAKPGPISSAVFLARVYSTARASRAHVSPARRGATVRSNYAAGVSGIHDRDGDDEEVAGHCRAFSG